MTRPVRPRGIPPAIMLAWLVVAGCADAPELPAGPRELEIFRRHSTWRPAPDVTVDVRQAPPSRLTRPAQSSNVGNVKLILGDSTNVSTAQTSQGAGYGLRMDAGRQDLARITSQVIQEQGDIFDFIVVFPTFKDLLNPGFAYFTTVQNTDSGIGLPMIDLTSTFGSAGRLQGFLNMNTPGAYTELDGEPISSPLSSIYAIMGQELTHRWLSFARVRKEGFNSGQTSSILLGRDNAHWSALMHTGPADPNAEPFVSVQDGVAWQDNGNGTFTVEELFSDATFAISPRARFSTLDLYLMGLLPPEEVEPFFAIAGARIGTQTVPANARLTRGTTVSGQRVDFTIDHVIAATGARMPSHLTAQREFNIAVVVLTRPGQTEAEVQDVLTEVEAFRRNWEDRFHTWTGGRGSVCTSLNGNCTMAHVALEGLTMDEDVDDGAFHLSESVTVRATVLNDGEVRSQPVRVLLQATSPAVVETAPIEVGEMDPGDSLAVQFRVTPTPAFACNTDLQLTVVAQEGGTTTSTLRGARRVGIRRTTRFSMEEDPGFLLNPDGADTATRGRWALGLPRMTDLRAHGSSQIILQPGEDTSDDGSRALLTDPGTEVLTPTDVGDTDVDEGITTIESPAVPISGHHDPVLSWQSWHTAVVVDTSSARISEATGDDLVTSVRVDDGEWIEVDRDASNVFQWKRKELHLRSVSGLALGGAEKLFIRFSVGDRGGEQNLVEAGIDAVEVIDLVDACMVPPVSSSSSTSGPADSTSASGPASTSTSGPPPSTSDADPVAPAQPVPPGCTCARPIATAPVAACFGLAWILARAHRSARRR